MTVAELIQLLETFDPKSPAIIEAVGIGKDDRSHIYGIEQSIYDGLYEVHIIAEGGREAT